MAVIGSNTFVVDAQDLASAKFKQIADANTSATSKMVDNAKRLGAATDQMSKVQSSARMATFSLTQAIQDAPYGFRGVANNIEFLTQNLVTLSASAGGARAAMSAIGATLSGPVGILFAVSAVSAAIQFLVPNLGQMGGAAKKAKPEIEGLSDVLGLLSKNIAGATTSQIDALFNKAKSDLDSMRKQLEDMKKGGERVVVGRSGLIARERVFTPEQEARIQSLNKQIERQIQLVNTLSDLQPGDMRRLKEKEDSAQKELDIFSKQLEERVRLHDYEKMIQGLYGSREIVIKNDLNLGKQRVTLLGLETEGIEKSLGLLKKRAEVANVIPQSLPEVKEIKPPDPTKDFAKDPTISLIRQFEELGATAENVNGLIVSSTMGAASAITDAFFGATKSIEEFFRNMVKSIVQLLVEELLVKGILKLLGVAFGFAVGGPVGGAVVGGASGIAKTQAKPTAEVLPSVATPKPITIPAPKVETPKAVTVPAPKVTPPQPVTVPAPKVIAPKAVEIPAPRVVAPRVPTVTIPAPRVIVPRPVTVETPARTQRVQSAATQAAPVVRESAPKVVKVEHTIKVYHNGESSVADVRSTMKRVERAIFTERYS